MSGDIGEIRSKPIPAKIREEKKAFLNRKEWDDYNPVVENSDRLTNDELIKLVSVLSNGYIKPDVREHSTLDGVRDTKKYFPVIEVCFEQLLKRIGITSNEILAVMNKVKNTNRNEENRY